MKKQIALAVLLGVSSPLFAFKPASLTDSNQENSSMGTESEPVPQTDSQGSDEENTPVEQQNAESAETDAQPQGAFFCLQEGFGFVGDQLNETVQSMQTRVLRSSVAQMLLKGVVNRSRAILNVVAEVIEIDGRQGEEQSESDTKETLVQPEDETKDEKEDEEIKKLSKALKKSTRREVGRVNRINELLAQLAEKQTIEDEKYARWLSEQPDEDQ